MLPIPLPRILRLFGSDKQKLGEHSYGEAYERLFRERRYRRLKILEIGILSGGSLLTWRAYFPWSVTVGLDIQDKRALAGAAELASIRATRAQPTISLASAPQRPPLTS